MSFLENQADRLIPQMEALLHPRAQEVLRGNGVLPNVRQWLLNRFRELGLTELMQVTPGLNAWNEGGYGIQSVSVQVRDPRLEHRAADVFLTQQRPGKAREPVEFKHPTIGIMAPGMLEGEAEWGIADFEVEPARAERLTALSPRGILLQAVPKGRLLTQLPDRLPQGFETYANGPDHVMRAVIELSKRPDAPRPQIQALLKNGVYACGYEYSGALLMRVKF